MPKFVSSVQDRRHGFLSAFALLQNQQEAMRLNALNNQYKIDHTHVYGWVKIVHNLHFACIWCHDGEGLLQTATRKKTGASP